MGLRSKIKRLYQQVGKRFDLLPGAQRPPKFSALALDAAAGDSEALLRLMPVRNQPLVMQAAIEHRYQKAVFVEHTTFEMPPGDVVFASVCNDKYMPGMEALVLSLARIYPGLTNRYVVFHDDSLSEFNRSRLLGLYPHFEFVAQSQTQYSVEMGDQFNHKRIGLLGYLSIAALRIEGASHVIILDTDLLILGDISPLWRGERIKACPDMGVLPFAAVSPALGRAVLNSGVLSFPASRLGPAMNARVDGVLADIATNTDPHLAPFADQKFWNILIRDDELEWLPQNFNAVKGLLSAYFPQELSAVSVLHLTGPKPWYTFVNEGLLNEDDKQLERKGREKYREAFALWHSIHRRELGRARSAAFAREMGSELDALEGSRAGRPAVMIGNGPSIASTDLSAFADYEKFVFNWFVNHESFDEVAPEHLVLASHMLFGGWHTPRPALPPEFLAALGRHRHKPRIWSSFYFRDYVESVPELAGYQRSYFFFEKPFKRQLAVGGRPELDVRRALVDSNTGVLTAGIPLAVHLGCKQIVLTGCDSNYGSAAGSYFYAADKHASKTTAEATLLATWTAGGEGIYGYVAMLEALKRRGVTLHDSTLGGKLTMLPRMELEEVRALGRASRASVRGPKLVEPTSGAGGE